MKDIFINIEYRPEDTSRTVSNGFVAIWNVDVDERYQPIHLEGVADFYLFITLDGEGEMIIEADQKEEKTILSRDTFFILQPRIKCRYRCFPGGRWRCYIFRFSNPVMIDELNLAVHQLYKVPNSAYARNISKSIIDEVLNRDHGYVNQIDNLICDYLFQSKRMTTQDRDYGSNKIKKIIRWIHHNFDKSINVDALIKLSEMNRTSFFKAFKKETGQTPIRFFLNLKLDSASLFLLETDMRTAEIAQMLSFYDEYHFSKMFKQRFGMAPSVFRKKRPRGIIEKLPEFPKGQFMGFNE